MARGANREAIPHLEQALETLRHLPETHRRSELAIDICIDIRNALYPLGDWARMLNHLQQAEVLARSLGDQHRLGRIATFMVAQRRVTGDYDAALKFGQEALAIARTLGDRSVEVIATTYLGETLVVRGEFREATKLLERNIGLDGELRAERFGTPTIQSAAFEYLLSAALAHLGQFDEAMAHGEAGLRIAEETDHAWTLFLGLLYLGRAQLRRGDFPRAAQVLERCLNLSRTWHFDERIPHVAAALSSAYALAGRTQESLVLAAGAFRARQGNHLAPVFILLYVARAYLLAGRTDEATNYGREALALTRQFGARGLEAEALSLTADIAAAIGAQNAESYYREAFALAEPRGMRPQVAHCRFGLGKLYCRRGASRHRSTSPPRWQCTAKWA
jgi:tetratricopeptide (TPR) repeat protein